MTADLVAAGPDDAINDASDVSALISDSLPTYVRPAWQTNFKCGGIAYQHGICVHRDRLIHYRCGRWKDCYECNVQNKIDWCACLGFKISRSKLKVLYCATIPMDRWGAIYERIKDVQAKLNPPRPTRKKGDPRYKPEFVVNYARIEHAHTETGNFYKICCEHQVFKGFDYSAKTVKEAVKFVRDSINLVGGDSIGHPVSTSRDWKFDKPEPEKEVANSRTPAQRLFVQVSQRNT